MIEISYETARKVLLALDGNKKMRQWVRDFFQDRMADLDRKHRMLTLAEEWLCQYVRDHEVDDPALQDMWADLEARAGDRTRAIYDRVALKMEDVKIIWDRKVIVEAPLPPDQLKALTAYVAQHLPE